MAKMRGLRAEESLPSAASFLIALWKLGPSVVDIAVCWSADTELTCGSRLGRYARDQVEREPEVAGVSPHDGAVLCPRLACISDPLLCSHANGPYASN